jgi:hypothetical protein
MIGMLVRAGDLIEARDARGYMGLGANETALFRAIAATPGQPSFRAVVEDSRLLNPLSIGQVDVARADVRRIVSSGGDPAVPAALSVPSSTGTPRELSWPLTLQTGRRYLARLELTGIRASMANEDRVTSGFGELGFSGVRATQEKPPGWPAEDAGASGKGTWFATGTWSSAPASVARDQDTQMVRRVWEA